MCCSLVVKDKISTSKKGRLTITIYKNVNAKLRDLQGELIMDGNKNWSFSAILNCVILAGIIGSPKLGKNDWKIIKSLLSKNNVSLKRFPVNDYVENLSEI